MPAQQRLPDATVQAARAALLAGAIRAAAEWDRLLGPEAGPVNIALPDANNVAPERGPDRPTRPASPGDSLDLGFEFQGGANGSARLHLDALDARTLANRLPGKNGDEDPLDASERAAVLELGSVLLGEAVAALLAGVPDPIRYSLPRLQGPTPGGAATPAAPTGPDSRPEAEVEMKWMVTVGPDRLSARVTLVADLAEWERWHDALARLGPAPERRAA